MGKHFLLRCLLLYCGFALNAVANDQAPVSRWDRNEAMAAVRSTSTHTTMREIGDIASLADGKTTLGKLKNIELRSDWPLPAREAAIYQFTRSLGTLPRDAVAVEVVQYLQNYRVRTLVPHQEHGDAYIPLFNIRGAAAGIENGWQRAEFAAEALSLLETDPVALVSAFAQSSSHNQRSGYLDALHLADMAVVLMVQDAAIEQLGETPGLTRLLALTTTMTTTITADTFAIRQLLINGDGAGVSDALKQIETQLDVAEIAALLGVAVQEAPATNAALAIAAWWPRLRHDPASRDLLIELLADAELGAAAALALAQSPDTQTIKILQDTASGDSDAARRAKMALELNRAQLSGDFQP